MSGGAWAWRWMLPASLLLLLGLAWPAAQTLQLALSQPSGLARLAADPRFLHSLVFSASFAFVSVSLELCLGMALALALSRPLPLSWLWRGCLLLPWALPSVVSSKLFAWLFHYQLGLVNAVLESLGLAGRLNWMASSLGAWTALLCLELWKTTPLVALMLLAGRQQIPAQIYEAASLDGARPAAAFRHLTLPLLRPFLVVAGLFRMADALRIFDSVWALTGGGPARATESLSLYAHSLFFRDFDASYGAWVSLGTLLLVLAVAALASRAGRFESDLKEAA